ncbi:GLPGLI family protein [Lutibacter sp.]|uniref:GLPGLI family protein n=1 Tax=Lutibacter sp. TaxID=1925666 RepID=UPI0025BDE505|nr:GLPGLI family protein [Lutibacter sp.]MCF6169277.1 GLPGLI family protein [Lutibacter sp.]
MKKLLLLIVITITQINIHSQNIEIVYSVSENTNDPILSTSTTYNLIIKNNQSVYYNNNDSLKQFKYQSFIDETKKIGELTRVKLSDNHYAYIKQDFFYKNYKKDTLVFNEIILNKKVFVGEKINLFDWDIQPKSDTLILNQKCQKAISKFRGRVYEAFFSTELSPRGGPWKFDGLPGVILSVRSLDNYFVIKPIKIIKNSLSANEINNVYDKEKIISWETFKVLFKKKLKQQLKKLKLMSEDGEGGSVEITDRIEDLGIKKMSF